MPTMAEIQEPTVSDPRELINSDLFGRLVERIVREKRMATEEAERVLAQTLGFLKACALNPDAELAPSEAVDVGWHTFILYTREYTEFCHRVAGRFIHHVPHDRQNAGDGSAALRATVAAMERAGLPVDPCLWDAAGDCSQCYQGCHDSPKMR